MSLGKTRSRSVPWVGEMSETPPDKFPLLGVDWVKAVAGALAAVSTTVLLSTLGAAGTLAGAAVGSLAATVATALYSRGLDRSRLRMRQLSVITSRPMPVRLEPFEKGAAGGGWRARLRGLPWRRLLPTALVMFLAVLAAVTAFELASGRTLASMVGGGHQGGTTISHVADPGSGSRHHTPRGTSPTPAPTVSTPAPTTAPSDQPSSTPSPTPSSQASTQPGPSESPSAPPPTDTPTPAVTPTITPVPGAPAAQ
jgi:hypothetical protein